MPPRAENGAAPAPAAALTPLSDEEVMATAIYKILMQFDTPKGIEVSASNKLWPNLADLPDVMFGTVDQWTHKARMKIKITWREPDGTTAFENEDLHFLLLPLHEFKLIKGPRGEALHLRGDARREHEAAQEKETIKITYMDGAVERVQVWTVHERGPGLSLIHI